MAGYAACIIAARTYVEVPHTGGSAPRYGQSRIYMNGSKWRGEGSYFNRPTAQAGAFLRVTPQ